MYIHTQIYMLSVCASEIVRSFPGTYLIVTSYCCGRYNMFCNLGGSAVKFFFQVDHSKGHVVSFHS